MKILCESCGNDFDLIRHKRDTFPCPECLTDVPIPDESDRLRALLREALEALNEYGLFGPSSVNGGAWISFPPQQLAHSAELAAKIREAIGEADHA